MAVFLNSHGNIRLYLVIFYIILAIFHFESSIENFVLKRNKSKEKVNNFKIYNYSFSFLSLEGKLFLNYCLTTILCWFDQNLVLLHLTVTNKLH